MKLLLILLLALMLYVSITVPPSVKEIIPYQSMILFLTPHAAQTCTGLPFHVER